MDNQLILDLIGILEQENRVYDDILKISKNKTNIIIEGKVSELESIVKLEQSLVLQMGKLESQREEMIEKMSGFLKVDPADITITELMKYLEPGQAMKLKGVQDKLGNTLKELKGANELNSKLIKNSLDYISFSVNILTDAGTGSNNYGHSGQVGDSKKRSFFDIKL